MKTRSAKPVTIYACVGVRRKAREIFWTTYALQRLAMYELHFDICHLLETTVAVWFLKPIFTPFKNRKLVLFRLREFWDTKNSFIDRICVQEQQLYVKVKVQKSTTAVVRLSALSPDASKMSWVWNENYHLCFMTLTLRCVTVNKCPEHW